MSPATKFAVFARLEKSIAFRYSFRSCPVNSPLWLWPFFDYFFAFVGFHVSIKNLSIFGNHTILLLICVFPKNFLTLLFEQVDSQTKWETLFCRLCHKLHFQSTKLFAKAVKYSSYLAQQKVYRWLRQPSNQQLYLHRNTGSVIIWLHSLRTQQNCEDADDTSKWLGWCDCRFWNAVNQKGNEKEPCESKGLTRIWTAIAGFRVQSANRYTMRPCQYHMPALMNGSCRKKRVLLACPGPGGCSSLQCFVMLALKVQIGPAHASVV